MWKLSPIRGVNMAISFRELRIEQCSVGLKFQRRCLVTKTIWILAIVAAFVAGSAGRYANAQAGGVGDNLVAGAIDRLTDAILNTAIQGPEGPQGIQGDQGPAGGISTYSVEDIVEVPANVHGRARPQCDSGDVATGGGFSLPSNFTLRGNAPINSSDQVVSAGEAATG